MPGMGGSSFTSNNPLVVSMFHHSVFQTSVSWIIAIALVTLIVASVLRRVNTFNLSPGGLDEPRSRTYLRMAFGAIWLVDGILQFQSSMPLAMANGVVAPAAAGTPSWLHALMFDGIGIWNNHPIALAVGTAWIQVGIGLLLLVSNAKIGRLAAAVSVGWAAMIWLVGNGAGGIFQSSNSILFGWPGASLFYVVAGVWLALPPSNFPERFSRYTLRGLSVLVAVGAFLQFLPSRGFWHGGNSNALTTMTTTMTQTPQPHLLAWVVKHFGDFAGTIGGGFNVAVILWLGLCSVGLWMASDRGWRWPTQRTGHRLPVLLGGGRGRSVLGWRCHGRELLDSPGGPRVVRQPGARNLDAAAQTFARRDAIEFGRGRRLLRVGDGVVLGRVDGVGDRCVRREHPVPRAERPRGVGQHSRAGLHTHRPIRRHVLHE